MRGDPRDRGWRCRANLERRNEFAGRRHRPGQLLRHFQTPDPVAFVAAHAQGANLWTTDGRKLVDCVLGSGPMMIGHAHPQVVAAIQDQAVRGTRSTP